MKRRISAIIIMLALILQCLAIVACNTDEPVADPTDASTNDSEEATEKPTDAATDAPKPDDNNDDKDEDDEDDEEVQNEKEAKLDELLELRHDLRAHENGDFKVIILSDIQGDEGYITIPDNVLDNIKTVVDRENPDLVIFNGDNSHAFKDARNLKVYLTQMTQYLEDNEIPWAHVYGNHDDEGGISKERQSQIYGEFEYCISKVGSVSGVGNFVLPVYSYDGSKILYNVWCLDSHSYTSLDEINITLNNGVYFKGKYDWIKQDQIAWYLESSRLLEEYNGAPIPAMMAFHIPLQESGYAWMVKDSAGLDYEGVRRENGGFSATNSGLFSAALARGDVKLIVNGHDHVNDFMVNYHGIKLCYSSTVSTMHYHDKDMLGARVIKLNQGEDPVETYMSYIDEDFSHS